jgi:RNA polymerase sigma-70 factor, ECF subfamily
MQGAFATAVETPAALLDVESAFREHHARVLRAAYRVTGSMADAEDVAQTVFLRLASRPKLERIDNLGSYLHRAAVNAAVDVVRKRETLPSVPLDGPEEGPRGPVLVSPKREPDPDMHRWLRQALVRLHPRTAEMFVLRYLEGYDNREIARMMQTQAAVVSVTLFRARARLQKDYRAFMRGAR